MNLTEVKQEIAHFRQELDEVKYELRQFENRMEQGFAAIAAESNAMNNKLEQSFDGVVSMLDITQNHVIETQNSLSVALYSVESHD